MVRSASARTASVDSLIGRLADEYAQCLGRGEQPDIEDFANRHPDHADLIRKVLGSVDVMCSLSEARQSTNPLVAGASSATGQLGDFRIIREIGRGGMGVVYEAEQISLGRRVALKILPFAAVLDKRQLQRFKNEAQAAAVLDHPHIVGVYSVGCERGVHYYAMKLVDGHSLAEAIGQLRRGGETNVAAATRRKSIARGETPGNEGPIKKDSPAGATSDVPAATRRKSIARGETPGNEESRTNESLERATEDGAKRNADSNASAAPPGLRDDIGDSVPGAFAPGYSPSPVPGLPGATAGLPQCCPGFWGLARVGWVWRV